VNRSQAHPEDVILTVSNQIIDKRFRMEEQRNGNSLVLGQVIKSIHCKKRLTDFPVPSWLGIGNLFLQCRNKIEIKQNKIL
jgi:hypothetical protein